MRILVTGGAGFVGANLLAHLSAAGGHEVVVLDSEVLGKREFLDAPPARFVRGDLRDPGAVRDALAGCEAVVHLAADTRVIPSIENPRLNFEVNCVGTLNLLDAMREAGVTRLVNASTGGAIVGDVEPPVTETMPPSPLSPYGASKLAVEGYVSAYAASYGIRGTSLRFSNVYGPRSFHKGSVVALFMKAILRGEGLEVFGDGEQTRDFVFVADLCRGITAAIASPGAGVVQLGTGVPTSLNRLIALLRGVTGRDFAVAYRPGRAGEVMNTYCSIERARATLGYDPAVALEEGLRATWAWFGANEARFARA